MNTVIYTDASYYPTTGQAGAAAIMVKDGVRTQTSRPLPGVHSSHEAEAEAILLALKAQHGPIDVIASDCYTVVDTVNRILNGKRYRTNSAISTRCREIARLIKRSGAYVVWIRGHNGHPENSIADQLAKKAARGCPVAKMH